MPQPSSSPDDIDAILRNAGVVAEPVQKTRTALEQLIFISGVVEDEETSDIGSFYGDMTNIPDTEEVQGWTLELIDSEREIVTHDGVDFTPEARAWIDENCHHPLSLTTLPVSGQLRLIWKAMIYFTNETDYIHCKMFWG